VTASIETRDKENAGQPPSHFSTIFVLDCSKSMGDKLGSTRNSKIELSKASLVAALSKGKTFDGDKVGILSVNTNILGKAIINEVVPLTEIGRRRPSIPMEKIMGLRNEGGTALISGIELALEILSSGPSNTFRSISVITDSRSGISTQNGAILTRATKSRTRINFVILGEDKGKKFDSFRTITELTGGKFVIANTSQDLEDAVALPHLERSLENIEQETDQSPEVLTPETGKGRSEPRPVEGRKGIELSEPQERELLLGTHLLPVVPKRKKAETLDDIERSVNQLTGEYASLEAGLRDGSVTHMQFTEKYSIIQYELAELKQTIRELRSKNSREMTELALVKGRAPKPSSILTETSARLLQLDRRISSLQKSVDSV